MSETKKYIETLFAHKNMVIAKNRSKLFDEFIDDEKNKNAVKQIQENQKMMIDKWLLKEKIQNVIDAQLIIPNATVGKSYNAVLDFVKLGLKDLIFTNFDDIEKYGLTYDKNEKSISGIPTQSGDFKVIFNFLISGEDENNTPHKKQVSLIINADPKSLWKDIASDIDKDDEWKQKNFWKPDNENDFQALGNKHIVVASKRGRSHANVGSFREDNYKFRHFENTGWSLVCVADGAGSAKLSRLGSKIACDSVVSYFEENWNEEAITNVVDRIKEYNQNPSIEFAEKIKALLHTTIGKASFQAYKNLEAAANKQETPIKDFHSTLIFALYKKYEFGYVVLSFGVGDCPIGILNKEVSELNLLNWLDVGEFGGGTRFITMPEIFSNANFYTRFGFKLIDDFSYLILMTDGIYDPKFVVEANLEKIENWKIFLDDLKGNNDDKFKVDFNIDNNEIANQLSAWMDFWSPGNHDDRTLAIVF